MKYEFDLDDYWDILDRIHERKDVGNYGFEQIKVAEDNDRELYVYGYRLLIPELNMTVREGVEYYKDEDGEEQPVDSIVLYDGDERNPENFSDSYCNTFLPSLIGMLASYRGKNTNPKCIIDDSEFVFWKENADES